MKILRNPIALISTISLFLGSLLLQGFPPVHANAAGNQDDTPVYLPLVLRYQGSKEPEVTPVPSVDFLETFDGDPSSPETFKSPRWDISVHTRNLETLYSLEPMDAAHGPGCEPPPATHRISRYEETVYNCRDHVMTAINDRSYGVIYLTPNHLVDFSKGEAVIRFDMSTQRASLRDWVDLWITPYGQNLQLPAQEWMPDLQGPPKDAVLVEMQFGGNYFLSTFFRNFKEERLDYGRPDIQVNIPYDTVLTPSPTERTTFELHISRDRIRFGLPDYDFYWFDVAIDPPLTWDQGVVRIGHHSYTPDKDCKKPGDRSCQPNTWHWDNVEISPAVPFTILHADRRYVDTENPSVVFEKPAPDGAYLRFSAIGSNLEVSFDQGKTWQLAIKQTQKKDVEDHFSSYWTPVPSGVTSVHFRGQRWSGGDWHARNITIWSIRLP